MKRRVTAAVWMAVLGLGFGECARGVWIPAKAELAQLLLRRAWVRTCGGVDEARPWPWADTWPVARLRMPEHDTDLIVLAGASGSTMAFAPGHLHGTAAPGESGICVIAGHRDTHFDVLDDLEPGQRVELELRSGARHRYLVTEAAVVHERDLAALDRGGPGSLVLLTCWSFDGVGSGGELRYLVRAAPEEEIRSPASSCATS
ncbi:MAG: class GN sortase [Thermoanaerobaculales bacterium]|jgi:sortase A|nr:class GN sortase [Thermoanaerobaculales bacterium]